MWYLFATVAQAGPGTVLLSVVDPDRPPAVEAIGARLVRCFRSSRICLVEGADPADLSALPGVRRAEWDAPIAPQPWSFAPTADCPNPYELDAIDVQGAWASVRGAHAPLVAIEDSGFRDSHRDLAGRIADQWDYGDDDPVAELSPQSGVPEHGTFIAGIIAANADDAGRTGVAPESSLFLQKIADSDGALYFSYAIAAMDDLAANHPEVGVMNYSLAASAPPDAFRDAVEGLGDADIVVVAAAANCSYGPNCYDGDDDVSPEYPASYPYGHVLAVASLRANGSLDPYSHFGLRTVDVAAPGADLCSLGVEDDHQVLIESGTSYATPVAAGVAALVRERWPRLDAADVVQAVVRSCVPDDRLVDRVACGGGISADRAIRVPVVRFEPPADVEAAPTGEIAITGDSRAAGGRLFAVVTTPDDAALALPDATAFGEGDPIPVPGGDQVAEQAGVWLEVDLAEDGPVAVRIPVEARSTGIGAATVRLIPYADDVVGAESSFVVVVGTAVLPASTDTAPAGHDPAEPRGCGCDHRAPVGFPAALLAMALLSLVRRSAHAG